MNALTMEVLRAAVIYDPETGHFVWRERTRDQFRASQGYAAWKKKCQPGACAGSQSGPYGYWQICVGSKNYWGHRLAWFYTHGKWPDGVIDHINGDGADNRIVNLRDIPAGDNQRNMKRSRNNTSGVCGVRRSKYGTWRAGIWHYGKIISLGSFPTKKLASAVRKDAELRLGYHPNHGRT